MASCLFCALPCPFKKIKREISDDFNTAGDNDPPPSKVEGELPLFDGEPSSLQAHLRSFFVLTKILKVSNDTISNFLQQDAGESHLEPWVDVCTSCGERVREFYSILKEISRLERSLVKIEVDLKKRIYNSHDAGGSSIWRQVRSEVLEEMKNETTVSEPNKIIENDTDMKNDFDKIIIIPNSASAPHSKTNASGRKLYIYNCPHCPFESTNSDRLAAHSKVHQQGADSVSCPDCGIFVFRSRLAQHRGLSHGISVRARKRQKKKELILSKPTSKSKDPSSLFLDSDDATSEEEDKLESPPTSWFNCPHCPFKTFQINRLDSHSELHKKGSQTTSVICPEPGCGWFLLPHRVEHHLTLFHRRLWDKVEDVDNSNPTYLSGRLPNSSIGRYFRCRECPYETPKLGRIKIHVNLHDGRSSAVPCPICGWLILSDKLPQHYGYCHERELSENHLKEQKMKVYYYKCPECNSLSGKVRKYREHEKMHENGTGIVCSLCGWLCSDLKRHNNWWHSETGVGALGEKERVIKVMEMRKTKIKEETLYENV